MSQTNTWSSAAWFEAGQKHFNNAKSSLPTATKQTGINFVATGAFAAAYRHDIPGAKIPGKLGAWPVKKAVNAVESAGQALGNRKAVEKSSTMDTKININYTDLDGKSAIMSYKASPICKTSFIPADQNNQEKNLSELNNSLKPNVLKSAVNSNESIGIGTGQNILKNTNVNLLNSTPEEVDNSTLSIKNFKVSSNTQRQFMDCMEEDQLNSMSASNNLSTNTVTTHHITKSTRNNETKDWQTVGKVANMGANVVTGIGVSAGCYAVSNALTTAGNSWLEGKSVVESIGNGLHAGKSTALNTCYGIGEGVAAAVDYGVGSLLLGVEATSWVCSKAWHYTAGQLPHDEPTQQIVGAVTEDATEADQA